MKLRFGLVLTMALGVGACAGGASSGGGSESPSPMAVPGGTMLAQGERPRQDDDTQAAQKALDEAGSAQDDAASEAAYTQALTSARAAIAADSTNPLAWRLAGVAAIGAGEYVQADKFLDKAEELRPIYALETEGIREQAWLKLYQEAAPLVNQNEYEKAAAIFENANAIYDQRPEVMITLGQIYAQLGQYDKSIENLDKASALISSDKTAEMDSATVAQWKEQAADIPITKATVLAQAGRFEDAVGLYRDLVAKDPDNVALSRNLAAILLQMGNKEEAFQVYDRLLSRPDLASGDMYNIGVGFYQGEDYTRAAAAFEKAATKSVKDRDAIEMWTRSLQIDSAYAKVAEPAQRWIALDPYNQNGYLIMAQAVNHEGDGAKASELVSKIESLKVLVNDLQLQDIQDGAQVSGSVMNKALDPGTNVTLHFTFYDDAGNAVGTEDKSVSVGAADSSTSFQLQGTTTGTATGYGYTLDVG